MPGLLLVEDEEAIRSKLRNNVDWAKQGFAPILTAGNGLEALAALEENPVEIMVTDIQMPKMNGIELIKEIKNRGYRMKIVVISGFAEFEYAQESIKLNVADYLLKPFASRKLLEIVLRLREEIAQEQAERSELSDLRAQLGKSMAALREKLFLDLLNGSFSEANLQAELNFLGLGDLVDRQCQVAVVEIPEGQLRQATAEDKYLLNLRLLQEAHRLTAAADGRVVVNHHRNQLAILFFGAEQDLAMRLEEFLAQLRLALGQSLACGVGHQYKNLSDLHISYQEACLAMQYRYLHGLDRVYSFNDVNLDNPSYHKSFYSLYQNRIFDDLRIGADRAVQEDLKALLDEMRCSEMSPESIRIVAGNLLLLSCAILNELGHNPSEIVGPDFSPLIEVNRAESLAELEELMRGFFERINGSVNRKRASTNQNLVDEIRRHIDEHYAEEITLSGMAEHYRISPSYLSLLFTERSGKNFIDYLTERRIKKAKELLKHTDLRIYEIAGAVGYNDSYYFSNCFKKAVGVTPSEYRGSLEDGEESDR